MADPNREIEFRNLVRGLLAQDIYPSPSAINAIRRKQGKSNTLGSDHTRWRREELHAAGFRRWDGNSKVLKNPGRYTNARYIHPNFKIVGGMMRRREESHA